MQQVAEGTWWLQVVLTFIYALVDTCLWLYLRYAAIDPNLEEVEAEDMFNNIRDCGSSSRASWYDISGGARIGPEPRRLNIGATPGLQGGPNIHEPVCVRDVATKAQTTNNWWWQQPRFVPLGIREAGVRADGVYAGT